MKTPQSLNYERIVSLVGITRNALGVLDSYREVDKTVLLGSSEKLGNIKYQFIVAIESCIDLCAHIAARTLMQAPESYAHCFELLQKTDIIRQELAGRMSDLARFRNVLVHLYWTVDDRRVIEKLHGDLRFIADFLNAISSYADSTQASGSRRQS